MYILKRPLKRFLIHIPNFKRTLIYEYNFDYMNNEKHNISSG